MKRILAMLLAVCLLLSLCGCGSGVKLISTGAAENLTGELPEMGNIYLTVSTSEPWEYMDAKIRADWTGTEMPEQPVQIKLRGNSSMQTEKKSYNIKFTEKVSFMGLDEGKKWSLLANPFDKSMLRIALAFDYAQNIGLPYVSQFRFCNLWLNDRFMGVYMVMEPISDGKKRIDIDVKQGDVIYECDADRTEEGKVYFQTLVTNWRFQINEPEAMSTADAMECKACFDSAYSAALTLDHTIYEEYLDVESFVNFYIFHEVVKDIDFNRFSTRYFLKDGKLYAGPPWDLDLSMGNVSKTVQENGYLRYHNRMDMGNTSGDSTQALWAQTGFYEVLCQDPYFMDLVRARWQELKPITENLVTDNEIGRNQMDRYLEAYEDEILNNYDPEAGAGWAVWQQYGMYADQSVAIDYEGNVEELRTWLTNRIAWLDAELGAPAAE